MEQFQKIKLYFFRGRVPESDFLFWLRRKAADLQLAWHWHGIEVEKETQRAKAKAKEYGMG
jgi:hypothetical protein